MATDSSRLNSATCASPRAGRLPSWQIGELPCPPGGGWRLWVGLLGPGVLLAGASVGTGEWLFGPAVTAQYGGTLLWLASISIIAQVFCNLEMMRYTLYCGEPIVVGYFRTWPGPLAWTFCYALLDIASIWPYNASNAAVPLAAAVLGHLPGNATTVFLGISLSEGQLVKLLGYIIFLAAFIPLIFGGAIYKMLQRIMVIKLVLVLGYLSFIAIFMVSERNAWEILSGFFRFGDVPLRADSVVVGNHFTLSEREGTNRYTVAGTVEGGQPLVTAFVVAQGDRVQTYGMGDVVPTGLQDRRHGLMARAEALAERGGFFIEAANEGVTLTMEGRLGPDRSWLPERIWVTQAGSVQTYDRLEQVPEPLGSRLRSWIANQGLERVSLVKYGREHGRLPDLDWAMLAAFAAIAGIGGLANTMFSNFARDKGWGMGARVGAIPSLVGGRLITLSHVGQVFPLTPANRTRWSGWIRHVVKDQVVVWPCRACYLWSSSATFQSRAPAWPH
jgi:hypothetical protein